MESTMEMMGAHGMVSTSQETPIKGRAAFNAYCRQPGTRIARIYDDMDAGLDNLQIAIAYHMDIMDVNVYRAAWKAYSSGPVGAKKPQRNGIDNACVDANISAKEPTRLEQTTKSRDATPISKGNEHAWIGADGMRQCNIEKCRGAEKNSSTAQRDSKADVSDGNEGPWNSKDVISNGKEKHDTAMQARRQCVDDNGQAQSRQSMEGAEMAQPERKPATVIEITKSVRALMAQGAGISRIAARLGITRVKATLIVQKIERGG